MSETAEETRREEAVVVEPKPSAAGTPAWVWVVYGLGALSATVFVGSLVFVAISYATAGDGDTGVDISMPALVIWLALALGAFATFVWRRWGRQQ